MNALYFPPKIWGNGASRAPKIATQLARAMVFGLSFIFCEYIDKNIRQTIPPTVFEATSDPVMVELKP